MSFCICCKSIFVHQRFWNFWSRSCIWNSQNSEQNKWEWFQILGNLFLKITCRTSKTENVRKLRHQEFKISGNVSKILGNLFLKSTCGKSKTENAVKLIHQKLKISGNSSKILGNLFLESACGKSKTENAMELRHQELQINRNASKILVNLSACQS